MRRKASGPLQRKAQSERDGRKRTERDRDRWTPDRRCHLRSVWQFERARLARLARLQGRGTRPGNPAGARLLLPDVRRGKEARQAAALIPRSRDGQQGPSLACARQDSNLRPLAPEASALSPELRARPECKPRRRRPRSARGRSSYRENALYAAHGQAGRKRQAKQMRKEQAITPVCDVDRGEQHRQEDDAGDTEPASGDAYQQHRQPRYP